MPLRLCAAAAALLVVLCAARGSDLDVLCANPNSALHRFEVDAATDADKRLRLVQAYAAHALTCSDGSAAPLPSLRARRLIEETTAALTLFATAGDKRDAVATLTRHADILPPGLAQSALARTHDPRVLTALRGLVVAAGLHAADIGQRLAAIKALGGDPTQAHATTLASLHADPVYAADPRVRTALDRALSRVRLWLHVGRVLSLLYNGVSAGSVLFMSAVGLAIIFGLMGVINLAQGEFITVGAYTTFCVQQAIRTIAPGWLDWYPIVSIPVVFTATGLLGIAIEVAVIRHLYRRPLMTLLATWAISLLLINLVRVVFGTQNVEFVTPSYLTGGTRIVGDFVVTWNHLVSILAAVAALTATAALLRLTDLGLFIRAVTQNRAMAGCVGVSPRRTDMAAFGFGAGLAGLGGLALSPIYSVNPSMGTGLIIDSFMVVVLGGGGSLFGTAAASLGIGLVNVGIEPFYGAVAAKVIALLLIIAIIQWRPEGLVPARGRR